VESSTRVGSKHQDAERPRLHCSVRLLLKVYFYDLEPRIEPVTGLDLVTQTYTYLVEVLQRFETREPEEADFFFAPVNLIKWQFANEDPDLLGELSFLSDRPDHLLIALGDYSQRDERNRFGHAYRTTYDWIGSFTLLALQATGDLLPRDIAVIPANTLESETRFNNNERRYLWSFLGTLGWPELPPDHVRSRLKELRVPSDALLAPSVPRRLTRRLRRTYRSSDPYELVARNSVFTLCPAGFGSWTYRFFQAIQWGSIPVLISDDYTPPFAWEIPYSSFSLRVPEAALESIDDLLRSLPARRVEQLQRQLRMAQSHFTPKAFEQYFSRSLENLKQSGYRSSAPLDATRSLPVDLLADDVESELLI
jgi:hypothetical protein